MSDASSEDPSAIRRAVEADPDTLVDEYDRLIEYANSESPERRVVAARCFATAAGDYPGLVADSAPAILELLSAETPTVKVDAARAIETVFDEGEAIGVDDPGRETVGEMLFAESREVRAAAASLLATVAPAAPDIIDSGTVETALDGGLAHETRVDLLEATAGAARQRPTSFVSLAETLDEVARTSLGHGSAVVRTVEDDVAAAALRCLYALTREVSKVAVRFQETLLLALDRAPERGVEFALRSLDEVATDHPEEFLEHHESVRAVVESDRSERVRYWAARTYLGLASGNDNEVMERVDDVVEPALDLYAEFETTSYRDMLGWLFTWYVDVRLPLFESLPEPFPTDVQNGVPGAVAAVRRIAYHDTSYVFEYVPALRENLDDEDTQDDAACALARIGAEHPERLREADVDVERVETLIQRHDVPEGEVHALRTTLGLTDDDGATGDGDAEADTAGGEDDLDFRTTDPDVDFDDVVGMDDLKRTATGRITDPLEETDLYERFGVDVQRGFLFYGPPGTGKTFFAKALAGESGFTFFEVSIADIVSKWVGEAPKNAGNLIDQAIDAEPCLVFLDEIDAIATDRGTSQTKSERQVVNQLLEGITRIEDGGHDVVVVGATNRAEDVDEALLRSGRLSERVEFTPPDGDARVELFETYCKPETPAVDEAWLKEVTEGLVQADVAELAEEAAYQALLRHERGENDAETVSRSDVETALETIENTASQDYDFRSDEPDVDFDDVVGMDDLKRTAHERILDPLEETDLYERFGVEIQRGFLFHGPPGTGKTFFARAMAAESRFTFLEVDVDDVVSKWIGEGARNVGDLFDQAVVEAPTVVFLDEIDALGTKRQTHRQHQSERERVNQLLTEVTRIQEEEHDVVGVGATNRIEDVDDALLRSGRLGEHVEFTAPDGPTRVALFETHCEPTVSGVDPAWLRQATDGMVHADVAKLGEEAAYQALRRYRDGDGDGHVTRRDVETALEQVESGDRDRQPPSRAFR